VGDMWVSEYALREVVFHWGGGGERGGKMEEW
jgi:hypothetical protein